MKTIRVSGVQMLVSPQLDDNLPKILEHIVKTDADFILFPEMSLTGYHGKFSDKATRAAWRQIGEACRHAYKTALVGTGFKEDGHVFIQTRIFGPTGKVMGTYEKLVPTSGDREFCRPGEELRTFTHMDVTFGCLICNDLWVTPGCGPYPDPRLAYHLGKKGVQAVFHSINSGSSAVHTAYHESNLALRAMESKFHIVTANAADPNGPVNAATGVVSPKGEWLTQCPRVGEHAYSIDLEIDAD